MTAVVAGPPEGLRRARQPELACEMQHCTSTIIQMQTETGVAGERDGAVPPRSEIAVQLWRRSDGRTRRPDGRVQPEIRVENRLLGSESPQTLFILGVAYYHQLRSRATVDKAALSNRERYCGGHMLRDLGHRFHKARRPPAAPESWRSTGSVHGQLSAPRESSRISTTYPAPYEDKPDDHQRATRSENATRFDYERVRVTKMVQSIDAEDPIEASRRPWQLLRAPANDQGKWCRRSRALQHLRRQIESRGRADSTPDLGKPMPRSASHFGSVHRPRLADEALKNIAHPVVAVPLVARVVRRRDDVVIHRLHHHSPMGLA